MTIAFNRDARGRLPVAGQGEVPCCQRHPWSGYGCQARHGHAPPCRYYSERGWHAEWYPTPSRPAVSGAERGLAQDRSTTR